MTKSETEIIKSEEFSQFEVLIKSFTDFDKALDFVEFSEKQREIIENSKIIRDIIKSWALNRIKFIGANFEKAIQKAADRGKIAELLNLKAVFETKEKTEDILQVFHYPIQEKEKK